MLHLKAEEAKYIDQLHPTDRHYLTKIPDKKQYVAACCAMGNNIFMHSRSASSGLETMNRANTMVHSIKTVDMLNSAIFLLNMEGNRNHQWKEVAWGREPPLTPKGMEHMAMVVNDVNVREYRLTTHTDMTRYYGTISKNT
jgi:hypothetical protein